MLHHLIIRGSSETATPAPSLSRRLARPRIVDSRPPVGSTQQTVLPQQTPPRVLATLLH